MMPGVEIDVRIELARDEVLVLERDLLEPQRQLEQRIVVLPSLREHLVAHLADDLGARIEILVDAVAEAHQPEVAATCPWPSPGTSGCCSTVPISSSIVEHGLVGAAVRRAPQRRDAGGDRRVRVGAGAAGQAHGRGAGVLLVVGVQDEQQVERLRGDRIDAGRARTAPRTTCAAGSLQ